MSRNTLAAAQAASRRIRKMFLLAGLLAAGEPAALGQDIYWIDDGAVIRRQTAAGVQDLVSSGHTIENLVLNTRAGQMYWSETWELSDGLWPDPEVESTIRRANLDGTGVVDLITEAGEGNYCAPPGLGSGWTNPVPVCTHARYVRGLTLDLTNNRLYWVLAAKVLGCRICQFCTSVCSPPQLRSMRLDGADPVTLSTLVDYSLFGPPRDDPRRGFPGPVAIDPRAGKLYWSTSLAEPWYARSPYILRANFDGSDIQHVVVEPSLAVCTWPTEYECRSLDAGVTEIKLDPVSKKIYWIEVQADARAICRANLDGSTPETLFSYSATFGETNPMPMGLSVDPVCGRMLWGVMQADYVNLHKCSNEPSACLTPAGPGRIFGANLDGTQIEELVAGFGVATAVGFAPPDGDSDGSPDCEDACPTDPAKTAPGLCDCGQPDIDTDSDGTPDCQDAPNGEPDNSGDGAAAAARVLLSNCGIGAAGALGVTVLGLMSMRRRRRMHPAEQ